MSSLIGGEESLSFLFTFLLMRKSRVRDYLWYIALIVSEILLVFAINHIEKQKHLSNLTEKMQQSNVSQPLIFECKSVEINEKEGKLLVYCYNKTR